MTTEASTIARIDGMSNDGEVDTRNHQLYSSRRTSLSSNPVFYHSPLYSVEIAVRWTFLARAAETFATSRQNFQRKIRWMMTMEHERVVQKRHGGYGLISRWPKVTNWGPCQDSVSLGILYLWKSDLCESCRNIRVCMWHLRVGELRMHKPPFTPLQ